MKIQLLSCNAQRPDKRAIRNVLVEFADGMDSSLANELAGYLLDGTPVEIDVTGKATNSAFRALRKINVDYEIM